VASTLGHLLHSLHQTSSTILPHHTTTLATSSYDRLFYSQVVSTVYSPEHLWREYSVWVKEKKTRQQRQQRWRQQGNLGEEPQPTSREFNVCRYSFLMDAKTKKKLMSIEMKLQMQQECTWVVGIVYLLLCCGRCSHLSWWFFCGGFFVVVFLWWFFCGGSCGGSCGGFCGPPCFTFTDNRAQQNNARFQQHNMWQQMYGQPPSASRQPESPVLGFQVRRTHLLEDAMSIARKLMVQNSHGSAGTNGPRIQDLKKPLKIKFHNEAGRLVPVEHFLFGNIKSSKGSSCCLLMLLLVFLVVYFWPGVDAGGVTKEFFQLLIEELFAKETGIQHIAAHFKHGFVSLVFWQRGHSFLLSLFPCFNPQVCFTKYNKARNGSKRKKTTTKPTAWWGCCWGWRSTTEWCWICIFLVV
jgi:hypothetical protein